MGKGGEIESKTVSMRVRVGNGGWEGEGLGGRDSARGGEMKGGREGVR